MMARPSSPRPPWTQAPHPAPDQRIEDAPAAAGMFNLLMGTEVGPRHDFIVGAAELDPSHIDT
jgi:DNA gyrase/topoisomerase IV subunit B